MAGSILLDENFPACFRVVFQNREDAETVANRVLGLAGVEAEQIRIVAPTDRRNGLSGGILNGASGSGPRRGVYVRYATVGLFTGGLLGMGLSAAGVRNPETEQWLFIAAFCSLGVVSAVSLAGLTSWRSRAGGPLIRPSAVSEEQGYALEIEVRDLSEQHALRQLLDELDVQITLLGNAGARTVSGESP